MLVPASAQAPEFGRARRVSGAERRFVGSWRLVSIESRRPNGEVVPRTGPLGADRIGLIAYDSTGHMGVQITARERPRFAGTQPTGEEALEALRSYVAYFGTYTVDEAAQTVTHHTVGNVNPNIERDRVRHFEFSGDRLTLIPPPSKTNGELRTTRLTWERIR
jgi:hypothetical protein